MITTNCSSESPVTVTAVMYLTQEDQSLLEKLENPEYCKQIAAIAKDMHINWAVTTNDNECFNLEVSRTFDHTVTVGDRTDMKKVCGEFAEEVSTLTLSVFENDCPSHEPANEEAEVLAKEIEFVKELKSHADSMSHVVVIEKGMSMLEVMLNIPARMCRDTFLRMIDAYLKTYE